MGFARFQFSIAHIFEITCLRIAKIVKNMYNERSSYTIRNYHDAVKKLQSLQSNSNYIKIATNNPTQNSAKLKDMEKYLNRSGISLEQLDELSVIHVAGTKGKGSVCAFTESILRAHGFRTGFYSSPHLITVKERFRINGSPIDEKDFAYYFWDLYRKLDNSKESELDMPMYFKFLTILMFNMFLRENIDVAIIEVGIGGEYDSTNIIRNPVCVGITSLALEHTSILGNTIEEIAYQKAGIFKPNTIAFTVPQQKEALEILKERAIERQTVLHITPSFQDYKWKNNVLNNTTFSQIQQQNASLAIQLAIQWMQSRINQNYSLIINKKLNNNLEENNVERNIKNINFEEKEHISYEKIARGLSCCMWPGRQEILKGTLFDFYLDGAHTIESMNCCISWFTNQIENVNGKRYLIFNMIGKRNVSLFIRSLKKIQFHKVYFVPNLSGIPEIDVQSTINSINEQQNKCQEYCTMWGEHSVVAENVMEIFNDIKIEHTIGKTSICKDRSQVLITGSLHLVGAALAILDPNLTMTTKF
ncbi:PREDICTED: folylpolyglutamate synthase, mitochondrial-like isoform X1 [Polistes canadensis]|uniref:folylpolyglutamate synthase, mitochondrial-like isoform X1 n=2 Tax=Polistes canadensis TaxID=91411 RepID=UPI000718F924|nr:PREDICTED: folylpolyglutamate synthase, mitochondrial-like isoform X1 [Polistes canadensis]XP_014604314.1 PREDICTED: folylpolyglutamate synthase, mitochondrial-like isoform X1 [Polistes canadensis]